MQGITQRQLMVRLVKAAGYEIVERAEDLVGNCDELTDMDICIRFPLNEFPRIEVSRTHTSRNSIEILAEAYGEAKKD